MRKVLIWLPGLPCIGNIFFVKPEYRDFLQKSLFELALQYEWKLEAWAIFSNHYHFIADSSSNANNLRQFLTHLHSSTARWLNAQCHTEGRRIWCNYRDTHLTFIESYFARLHYVMNNPVKHNLVHCAEQYPWCSKHWFMTHAPVAHQKVVFSFKTDSIVIDDDF